MQMKEKKTSVFEIESIPKAVAVLAIPSVLSMLVTVLYNMVDTVFVGQTHDPYQMNAVSMATPVFMILMAFGNLFGIGGCAFISRSLGAREYERVKKISSFSFWGAVLVGLLATGRDIFYCHRRVKTILCGLFPDSDDSFFVRVCRFYL